MHLDLRPGDFLLLLSQVGWAAYTVYGKRDGEQQQDYGEPENLSGDSLPKWHKSTDVSVRLRGCKAISRNLSGPAAPGRMGLQKKIAA